MGGEGTHKRTGRGGLALGEAREREGLGRCGGNGGSKGGHEGLRGWEKPERQKARTGAGGERQKVMEGGRGGSNGGFVKERDWVWEKLGFDEICTFLLTRDAHPSCL